MTLIEVINFLWGKCIGQLITETFDILQSEDYSLYVVFWGVKVECEKPPDVQDLRLLLLLHETAV